MRHASPAGLRARLQAPGAGQVSFLWQGTDHDPQDMEPGCWDSTNAEIGWRLDATRHLSSAAAFLLETGLIDVAGPLKRALPAKSFCQVLFLCEEVTMERLRTSSWFVLSLMATRQSALAHVGGLHTCGASPRAAPLT